MNHVKRFTKFAVMASVSGLIPFQVASGGVQTANKPAGHFAAVPASIGVSPMSGSGTTNDPISKPLTGFPDALQSRFHRIKPPEFFDRSQPGFKAITWADKIMSKATADGIESSSAGLDPVPKSSWDYLATPGLNYFNPTQPPLLLKRPAIHSFVSANGGLNFKLLNPRIQTGLKDQALQIENMSTRPWTSVVGWRPCESTFADVRAYQPHFDLFWIGATPER